MSPSLARTAHAAWQCRRACRLRTFSSRRASFPCPSATSALFCERAPELDQREASEVALGLRLGVAQGGRSHTQLRALLHHSVDSEELPWRAPAVRARAQVIAPPEEKRPDVIVPTAVPATAPAKSRKARGAMGSESTIGANRGLRGLEGQLWGSSVEGRPGCRKHGPEVRQEGRPKFGRNRPYKTRKDDNRSRRHRWAAKFRSATAKIARAPTFV